MKYGSESDDLFRVAGKILPGCDLKLYRLTLQRCLVQDILQEKMIDPPFWLIRLVPVFEDRLDSGRKDLPIALAGIPQKSGSQVAPVNTDLLPIVEFIGGQSLTVIQVIIYLYGFRAKELVIGYQSPHVFALNSFYNVMISLADQAENAPGGVEEEDKDSKQHRKRFGNKSIYFRGIKKIITSYFCFPGVSDHVATATLYRPF
jgi:hypothetical protein